MSATAETVPQERETNLSGLTTFLPDLSLRPSVAKSVLARQNSVQ